MLFGFLLEVLGLSAEDSTETLPSLLLEILSTWFLVSYSFLIDFTNLPASLFDNKAS